VLVLADLSVSTIVLNLDHVVVGCENQIEHENLNVANFPHHALGVVEWLDKHAQLGFARCKWLIWSGAADAIKFVDDTARDNWIDGFEVGVLFGLCAFSGRANLREGSVFKSLVRGGDLQRCCTILRSAQLSRELVALVPNGAAI